MKNNNTTIATALERRPGKLLLLGAGTMGKHAVVSMNHLRGWSRGAIDDTPFRNDELDFQMYDSDGLEVKRTGRILEGVLLDYSLVAVMAGLGGHTGYQGARAVARAASVADVATLGIFVTPFAEEKHRYKRAAGQARVLGREYRHRVTVKNSVLALEKGGCEFNTAMRCVNVSVERLLGRVRAWYFGGLSNGGAGNGNDRDDGKPPFDTPEIRDFQIQ